MHSSEARAKRAALPAPHSRQSHRPRSLLAGVRQAGPDSQYILCLDDDVLLHPGLLASLVRDMEADPSLFMATGKGASGVGCRRPAVPRDAELPVRPPGRA